MKPTLPHDLGHLSLLLVRVSNYLAAIEGRDQMVKDLRASGYNINQIHKMTGLGRTTIYRILGAGYQQDHGTERHTQPRKVSRETRTHPQP